jgi:chromosome segregation ATPase
VGGGSKADAAPYPYNYNKFAFTVGWRSNALALLRGNVLQDRVAELERERESLQAELQTRQTRVASLQLEIERYRAQNVLDLEQRRAQAEQALQAEREALRRIEERLRRLEQSVPPGDSPER